MDIAQGLDAIYIHAGGSPQAYLELKRRGNAHLDAMSSSYNGVFYRDETRKAAGYAYEHRLFLDGKKLADYLDNESKLRREYEEGYSLPLTFADDGTPSGGESASSISVKFSDYKTGVFDYDKDSGKYLVTEYGKPMLDGAAGTDAKAQLTVTNVLILETSVSKISGDAEGRLNVTLTGEGKGWYACGGKYIPIKWSKAGYTAPFVYSLTTSDAAPVFGRGVTYVNIIPKGEKVDFK
jgi:hypothetical protein